MGKMKKCKKCGDFLETRQYPDSNCEAEVCCNCSEEYNYRQIKTKLDQKMFYIKDAVIDLEFSKKKLNLLDIYKDALPNDYYIESKKHLKELIKISNEQLKQL